ncbi:MAG: class I SAM-dependent methyltransferase [Butyrivibrio sp.]
MLFLPEADNIIIPNPDTTINAIHKITRLLSPTGTIP